MGSTDINFNGYGYGYNYYYPVNQTKIVTDYAVSSTINDVSDSIFAGAGSIAAIDGTIGLVKAAKTAKKEGKAFKSLFSEYGTALKDVKMTKGAINKDAFIKTAKAGMKNSGVLAAEKCIPTADKLAKMSPEAQQMYAKAEQFITRSKNATNATASKASMKVAEESLAKAKALSTKNPFTKAINNFAAKSPTLAKGMKFVKASGAPLVAAFEGITEMITNVIPTFKQLGATKGVKQIGKSAVKVAGAAGGWAAGMAIGSAIGSIIPGAGTVVGGIIGGVISTVCSCVGSAAGSKLAKKITGPSELEKAKMAEEQNNNMPQVNPYYTTYYMA